MWLFICHVYAVLCFSCLVYMHFSSFLETCPGLHPKSTSRPRTHPLVRDMCFRVHLDKSFWCQAERASSVRADVGESAATQHTHTHTHTHQLKALHHFLSPTQTTSDPEMRCTGDLVQVIKAGDPWSWFTLTQAWLGQDTSTMSQSQGATAMSENVQDKLEMEFAARLKILVLTLNSRWEDNGPVPAVLQRSRPQGSST